MNFEADGSSVYPMNICGKIIKHNRVAAGLTQEQLAAKLQIAGIMLSRVQVSKIETGYRYITDYELAAFLRILGKDLLFGYLNEVGMNLQDSDFNKISHREGYKATLVAEDDKTK